MISLLELADFVDVRRAGCAISASNIVGASLSSMNSSASFLRDLQRLRVLRADLLDAASSDLRSAACASDVEAARGFFRIRAGVDRLFLVVAVAFLVLFVLGFGLFLAHDRLRDSAAAR